MIMIIIATVIIRTTTLKSTSTEINCIDLRPYLQEHIENLYTKVVCFACFFLLLFNSVIWMDIKPSFIYIISSPTYLPTNQKQQAKKKKTLDK